MRCLTGPSFRWAAILLLVLFDAVELLLILMEELCYLRQASSSFTGKLCYLRQPSSVLHGAGLEITNVDQIDNGTLLLCFFASRSEPLALDDLLWFRLLQSICTVTECRRSTAAVVPSYLVRRLGVPVVEFVQWSFTLTRSSRSLVNQLCGSNASVASPSMMSNSVLSYSVSSYAMELRPIDWTGSNALLSLLSLLSNSSTRFLLLSIVSSANR